jgi:hypothetical protein
VRLGEYNFTEAEPCGYKEIAVKAVIDKVF